MGFGEAPRHRVRDEHLPSGRQRRAAACKDRWQIELFFKALKQNLTAETFVGTTENAVKTQIWTALIAMLLLKLMQLRSQRDWSRSCGSTS